MESEGKDEIEIVLVDGCEGMSIYINDYRIVGNKPWGSGHEIHKWTVNRKNLIEDFKKAVTRPK